MPLQKENAPDPKTQPAAAPAAEANQAPPADPPAASLKPPEPAATDVPKIIKPVPSAVKAAEGKNTSLPAPKDGSPLKPVASAVTKAVEEKK